MLRRPNAYEFSTCKIVSRQEASPTIRSLVVVVDAVAVAAAAF